MRALVVGCGSIGRRHIGNLIQLANIDNILIFTKNKHCLDDFEDNDRIKIVSSLESISTDFAIIANETYKHIDTAIFLANRGIDLFIEKPVSHNLERVNVLEEIIKKNKKLKVFVGYNLRFLGALKYLKKQLSLKVIGDLYFAKIEVGQYLPSWRPDKDYRNCYSSYKEKGGGVALDLSHEIDYMRYLFGDPCVWKVLKTKVSQLEIDSEDMFDGIYQFSDKFVCTVHMDYLQRDKKREIRIVGSKGTIICDFIGKYIKSEVNGDEALINNESMFDINETYVDQLKHFISAREEKRKPDITLSDGIKVLELLEDWHV
jgi:predicted dehydrogenase